MIEQGEDPGGATADELASLASAGVDVAFLVTGQRTLAQDESDLVDNYRGNAPEKKTRSAAAGHAVEESQVTIIKKLPSS